MINKININIHSDFTLTLPLMQPGLAYVPLFVYGTLLCEHVLECLWIRTSDLHVKKTDWIKGYKLQEIEQDGEKYLMAVKTANEKDIISGGIIYVHNESINDLNKWEGEDYELLPVVTQDGSECFMYQQKQQ